MNIYIYIYIYRERERERDGAKKSPLQFALFGAAPVNAFVFFFFRNLHADDQLDDM